MCTHANYIYTFIKLRLFQSENWFWLSGQIFANNFNSKKSRARNLLSSKIYTPADVPLKKKSTENVTHACCVQNQQRRTAKHNKKRPKLVWFRFSWKSNIDCRNYKRLFIVFMPMDTYQYFQYIVCCV